MRKSSIRQKNLKTWIMKKGILRKTLVAAFMLLAAAPLLRAERIDVSGRVTDADRTPLLGVIVRAGAADGVLTDVNGNFLVKGVERGSMLTFSYIGYKTRSVAADSVRLHVVLESDNLQLEEECVVVGYGTEKQSLRAERMPRIAAYPCPRRLLETAKRTPPLPKIGSVRRSPNRCPPFRSTWTELLTAISGA